MLSWLVCLVRLVVGFVVVVLLGWFWLGVVVCVFVGFWLVGLFSSVGWWGGYCF